MRDDGKERERTLEMRIVPNKYYWGLTMSQKTDKDCCNKASCGADQGPQLPALRRRLVDKHVKVMQAGSGQKCRATSKFGPVTKVAVSRLEERLKAGEDKASRQKPTGEQPVTPSNQTVCPPLWDDKSRRPD